MTVFTPYFTLRSPRRIHSTSKSSLIFLLNRDPTTFALHLCSQFKLLFINPSIKIVELLSLTTACSQSTYDHPPQTLNIWQHISNMSAIVQQNSQLLTIPREIRDQIYGWIFHKGRRQGLELDLTFQNDGDEFHRALWASMTAGWFSTVLICRQVHSEAEPVMYQALYLKTSLLPGQVEVFLDSISFVGRVNLTSIHIDLCHWKWWEVIKAHGTFQKSLENASSYIKQVLVNLRRLSLTASWILICWTD